MIHKQQSSPNPPRPQLLPPQNKRIKIIHKQELFPDMQPVLYPHPQEVLSLRPHPQPQLAALKSLI